jgi:hypothetical protein
VNFHFVEDFPLLSPFHPRIEPPLKESLIDRSQDEKKSLQNEDCELEVERCWTS